VSAAGSVTAVALQTFEDLATGPVGDFGPYVVDEAEILEFGRRWDPQRMHVDPEAAGATIFGGLIASGWHTGSIGMRLAVDGWLSRLRVIGGTRMDDVRMLRPVRPGDALRNRVAVEELVPATPPRTGGAVRWSYTLRNQDDVVVLTGTTTMLVAGRAATPPRAPAG
jgi:acyl dehydratase